MSKQYSLTKEELAQLRPFNDDAKQFYRAAQALEAVVKNYIRTVVFARLNIGIGPDTKAVYDIDRGIVEVEEIVKPAPNEVLKATKEQGKKPIARK
ncbi:MAG: hypothetical protein PHQ43_02770 [Dehalococcoidales bacterium]|nr:hypothetical protein [Dehalococcoidales bacterium]